MFMPFVPQMPQEGGHGLAPGGQADTATDLREIKHQIQRLQLLNQAFWELVRDKLGFTDADLEQLIRAVDMRDGVEDGRMTDTALKCPSCGRISSSKHWKCLYCGQEFQKPVMG